MKFYGYVTDTPFESALADEPAGGGSRATVADLKTLRGAINRFKRYWPGKSFKVYTYGNFYDNSTFFYCHGHEADASSAAAGV